MEYKEWKTYTQEEKETLLKHWWSHFRQNEVLDKEEKLYEELVQNDPDKMFDLAVSSYIMGLDNTLLLTAMRGNFVGQLLDSITPVSELSDTDKEIISLQSNLFNAILVNSVGGNGYTKILELTKQEDSQ